MIVIAGGGPTGMMLAGELTLAGADVVVVERRTVGDLESSRAGGLYARTIEVLDQRGIAERFLSAGRVMQVQGFAYVPLDISDFPTRHNYGLALWQKDFERILAGWIAEIGVPVVNGVEVVGFTEDHDHVEVALSDGSSRRAAYLVGCDGGRSTVRKAAGIEFAGYDATISFMIAEVSMAEAPEMGLRREGGGIGPIDPATGGGPYRLALKEPTADAVTPPTLDDLRALLVATFGTDFGVYDPTWISRFTDAARQAVTYRSGRVLVAGDAAHIHSPHGGQGLNTGVQDAVNLGWKLAQVALGQSPVDLLDTYHAERHPVGARVLANTMAQVAITTPDDRHDALRGILADLLALDEPRRYLAGMLTGLDIRYDLGDGHPLLGRRMPDLDLSTADGRGRVYDHLRSTRPLLLNLGAPGRFDGVDRPAGVTLVDAVHDGGCELPLIGPIDLPTGVLVRPDGHVAWTGDHADAALDQALTTWFGGGSGLG